MKYKNGLNVKTRNSWAARAAKKLVKVVLQKYLVNSFSNYLSLAAKVKSCMQFCLGMAYGEFTQNQTRNAHFICQSDTISLAMVGRQHRHLREVDRSPAYIC